MHRPDLASPWPTDLSQLARRAGDDASVLEAMQLLDRTELRVLEVFAAVHEATVAQVVALIDEGDEEVASAVDRLWMLALLWGGPTYRIVRAAQQAFGPYPCGLAPAGHVQPDGQTVAEDAETFDPDDLRDLVWHNPVRESPHALLTSRGDVNVLPREAALVLRRGRFLPEPPAPPEVPESPQATGQFLWAPLSGVRYLLTELTARPLACHETRGVSRRTVADRAESMRVPVQDLMVWLELAAVAGLIGVDDGSVRPTAEAPRWLRATPHQMWSTLITAWLDSDRLLTWARPEELGCLTTTVRPRTSTHRRQVISVWPARSRLDTEALVDVVRSRRPRMHEAAEQATDFHAEVHALGLAEAGVATSALELLPTDVESASRQVSPAQARATLIIQPDHTVIAGADIDTPTWELLYATTSVESWGPVTTHRFDPGRIRLAVTGRDPEHLLEQLREASRTPLPQSVEYLFTDAARGSAVRLSRATLVEVNPADIDSVRDLGFSQLTDRVFSTDLDESVVRTMLNEAGITATQAKRLPAATPLDYAGPPPPPDSHAVSRLVARLVGSAESQHDPPADLLDADPGTMADVCRSAIQSTSALWLSYSEDGRNRVELIEPVDLRSGTLTGWSISGNRAVQVALSRIAGYQDAS